MIKSDIFEKSLDLTSNFLQSMCESEYFVDYHSNSYNELS